MASRTAATSTAATCCIASGPRRPSSLSSSTSKLRATSWSVSKSPRPLLKTFSSSLPEGGFAIETLPYPHAHAHPAHAAQQNVSVLQRDHALRLFLPLRGSLR